MSMTKRYLESLPAEVQDDILGVRNDDEWDDSAESEPEELWGCGGCRARWPLSRLRERGCPSCRPDDDVYRGEGDLEC